MEIKEILLPFFGFFIGAFGTLAGIGGGVITVPLLILAYSFESRIAVGTSIAVVLLNAVSGTFAYLAQRRVDLKIGIPFSIATVPGAVAGILLVKYISTGTFSFLFGIVLIAVGAYLAIAKERSVQADPSAVRTEAFAPGCGYTVNLSLGIIISLGVGLLAGLFGIGGGVIHVPCYDSSSRNSCSHQYRDEPFRPRSDRVCSDCNCGSRTQRQHQIRSASRLRRNLWRAGRSENLESGEEFNNEKTSRRGIGASCGKAHNQLPVLEVVVLVKDHCGRTENKVSHPSLFSGKIIKNALCSQPRMQISEVGVR
jgi:uncharacterized membrane protein YfcA